MQGKKYCKTLMCSEEAQEYSHYCINCSIDLCQGVDCTNLSDYYTPYYKLCKSCYNAHDLCIKRDEEELLFQNSESSRWLKEDFHDYIKEKLGKLCSNTRRKDSIIKYCANGTQIDQDLCLVCSDETFPELCQGLDCINKAVHHNDDYSICDKCSKKRVLIVNKHKECPSSLWVDDESRWCESYSYWSGLGETNYCKNLTMVDGKTQYCNNTLPPNVNKCYTCSTPSSSNTILCESITCINPASIKNKNYNLCEDCTKKDNLIVYHNGKGVVLCTTSDNRWSITPIPEENRCWTKIEIKGLQYHCTNIVFTKGNIFCRVCVPVILPRNRFPLTSEKEEIKRWITKEQFLLKKNKGQMVCPYSPPRGCNKDKFCGNIYVKVQGDYTDYRCEKCEGKVGRCKQLLEEEHTELTLEEILDSHQSRCTYSDGEKFCGKIAINKKSSTGLWEQRCLDCITKEGNLGRDLIIAYYIKKI